MKFISRRHISKTNLSLDFRFTWSNDCHAIPFNGYEWFRNTFLMFGDIFATNSMRLLLTNRYSKKIADKGRFRQLDSVLRKYLVSLKGGYDSYLSYENRRVILYFKYRRMSSIHLLAVIDHWNTQNPDININHINTPIISNQGLLYECLRVELTRERFRMYHYDPVDEDNIQSTKIDSEIIQVINQITSLTNSYQKQQMSSPA